MVFVKVVMMAVQKEYYLVVRSVLSLAASSVDLMEQKLVAQMAGAVVVRTVVRMVARRVV